MPAAAPHHLRNGQDKAGRIPSAAHDLAFLFTAVIIAMPNTSIHHAQPYDR
jgi:hypothetical protein